MTETGLNLNQNELEDLSQVLSWRCSGVVWCHAGFSCILMLVLMEIKCGRAELSCAIIICYVISPHLLQQIKLQNYIYFQPFTSHKAAASLELEVSAKNLRRAVKIYFKSRW